MEALTIIVMCVVAAVLYGIAHDLVTTRVCLEYFTIFHPAIFNHTHSPTLLALGWGVLATWWAGLFIGIALAVVARVGNFPKLSAKDLLSSVRALVPVMAGCAILAGAAGFFWGGAGRAELAPNFYADLWAHTASYASGFFGGTVICGMTYRRRRSLVHF
jgi:hypothetical protein